MSQEENAFRDVLIELQVNGMLQLRVFMGGGFSGVTEAKLNDQCQSRQLTAPVANCNL